MRSIRVYNKCRFSYFALTIMIVCICRRISDREIAQHARQGMGFDDVQMQLGAATQ
jgi:bacterioferritin-associated ferredoxin